MLVSIVQLSSFCFTIHVHLLPPSLELMGVVLNGIGCNKVHGAVYYFSGWLHLCQGCQFLLHNELYFDFQKIPYTSYLLGFRLWQKASNYSKTESAIIILSLLCQICDPIHAPCYSSPSFFHSKLQTNLSSVSHTVSEIVFGDTKPIVILSFTSGRPSMMGAQIFGVWVAPSGSLSSLFFCDTEHHV